ncbi:PLC-like phosphodiesterase, TIM beta/alpha-barrel domain protein [Cordyceps fumosorosea ARSEF 2679]|uniref:PLC-like phosphodiesterase, TIM beta/alpha-barrel domain protein n=1 Tax=Cordyceps fumosorosea (strain ARSEF 2679) TaxID=1081104 RepID=A0A162M4S2_CORFA|nr:PLC-like phosphodiesterase, TIM beta/alpha-barrel domain protein [Cordyceps fumosorosea ARSEF 2679]OAA50710.1 PLC-like phosphodiesterase, TIM beta/alpha-barrel domain protein [Cordyceps fumosorosea ARSEF 2679]
MRPSLAAVAAVVLAPAGLAQVVSYSDSSGLTFFTGTRTIPPSTSTGPPSGIYSSYGTQITLTGSNDTTTATSTTTTTPTSTSNGTTSATPTNTQPCNNYVEFCTRRYSNISFVAAHNSPFVRPGNSASNQALPVKVQLNDGIRLVQGQMQWPTNGTEPHFCHTSCDILDAGPIYDWLTEVREWVDDHPYDVVTILLGNGNYSDASLYKPFIEKSGIQKYAYTPPLLPMRLGDWPTLEELILRGKRVIMFLDYNANHTAVPWLLDEFSQVWETPFDPTDTAFPCTVQRPPDLKPEDARDRMYLMNHNLNAEFNVFDIQLLVPAVSLLNQTNAAEGPGSLGMAANNCRSDWGRAPNFLNVDYYNYGSDKINGSVFLAAARLNNVTYNRTCCGQVSAGQMLSCTHWVGAAALMLAAFLVL